MPSQRRLSPGGKFTPKSVKGLALWLDAASANTLLPLSSAVLPSGYSPETACASSPMLWVAADNPLNTVSNGRVVVLKDMSGNGSDMASGNWIGGWTGPTLVPDAINGLPAMRFNGSTDALYGFVTDVDIAMTMVAVVRVNASSSSPQAIIAIEDDGDNAFYLGVPEASSTLLGASTLNGDETMAVAPKPVIVVVTFVPATGAVSVYFNGRLAATGSDPDTHYDAMNIFLGNRGNGDRPAACDIAEAIAYWQTLTTAEINQLTLWLSQKYGIVTDVSPASMVNTAVNAPTEIAGCVGWWDAADSTSLYTTDAGAVTPVSSPTEIAGCVGWWDASDAASITASSGLVSQWNDKSGNNRHATASGSLRPTSGGSQNGRTVMQFAGTQALTITGNFLQSENVTLFAVAMKNTDHYGGIISSAPTNPEDSPLLGFYSTTIALVNRRQVVQQALANGVYGIVCGQANGTSQQGWFNGVKGTDSVASAAPNTAGTITKIGAFRTSGAADLNGNIAEIVCYSGNLSVAQRASVEAYLAAKWGISGVHTPATATSDPVGFWADKSGNGNHAVQATAANRPTISATAQNGNKQLAIASTQGNCLSTSSLALSAPYSLIAVVSSPSRRIGTFAGSGTNSNTQFGDGSATYSGAYYGASRIGSVVYGSAPIAIGQAQVFSAVASSGTLPSALSMWADGVGGVAATVFAGSPPPNNALGGPLQIGATGTSSWGGTVCEMMVFSQALSAVDRARVEKYLQQKWATPTVPDPTPLVGAWLDRSGNNRHAVQATAGNRPAISATTQGGKKALAFATQTTTVVSPVTVAQYVADATTSPKMLFAWVARPEGGASSIVFGSPTNPNSASRMFYASDYGAAGGHIVDFGNVTTARLTGTVGDEANNAGHVYLAFRDGAVMSIRRDGVEILRKTNTSGGFSATTGTLSINTCDGGSATSAWMEFMAYAASIPAANITRIERYLASRWGIALAPTVSNADAQDWINRVYQNGGSVSPATAQAVSQFCNSINDAGIRDRFYRLNLFAGSFQGAFVPLFRGIATGSGGNILTKHTNNDGGLFSSALWQVLSASTTTKGSQVAAPDGTLSATSVTLAGTPGTSAGLRMISNGDWVANATGTFSVWARKPASGGAAAIRLGTNNTAGWSTGVAQKFTLTTEWQRLAVSGAISNTSNLYALIGTPNAASAGAHDPDCNGIVELWRPQIEVGTTATSWQACQYGNATDTNLGSPAFLDVDYAETGATGGLTGNGSSKYLNTGFKADVLPQTDRHLSVHLDPSSVTNTGRYMIGLDNFGGAGNAFWGILTGTVSFSSFLLRAQSAATNSANVSVSGDSHIIMSGNGSATGYLNGVSAVTGQAGAFTAPALDVYVLGLNRNGSVGDYFTGRLNAYSIGLGMTAAQAAAYYTAMQAFQTALGRNV